MINITAVQFRDGDNKLSIFNVYNAYKDYKSIDALHSFMEANREDIYGNGGQAMWCGDFNHHHPLWDDDANIRLFTNTALEAAERLINLTTEYDMHQTLPKAIPTLCHQHTKKYTRPDNVFASQGIQEGLLYCNTVPEIHPARTDHFPIVTVIEFRREPTPRRPTWDYRMADWGEFKEVLNDLLETQEWPAIEDTNKFNTQVETLTNILQETIHATVPVCTGWLGAKRWWTKE
ncbi:hypothetical protein FA15DRAFT_589669, partial [Coprinopsis marcescibilis]